MNDKILNLLLGTSHATLEHLTVLSDENMANKLENVTEGAAFNEYIFRKQDLMTLSLQ